MEYEAHTKATIDFTQCDIKIEAEKNEIWIRDEFDCNAVLLNTETIFEAMFRACENKMGLWAEKWKAEEIIHYLKKHFEDEPIDLAKEAEKILFVTGQK
jgi:hypothetical protein